MTTLYLVRHGAVHNLEGIIYGRLPGYGLSDPGRGQLPAAAELPAGEGPLAALYASPLQRAQESAAIIAARLGMAVETAEPLVETSIGAVGLLPWQARGLEQQPDYPLQPGAVNRTELGAQTVRVTSLS